MRHITALLIKFAMIAIALEVVLGMLTTLSFTDILYIAASVTILAYIIGDLFILRATNNTIATIADTGLVLLNIYAFNYLWNINRIDFSDALISAVVIGVGEWFFHKYVANNVFLERH